jgi:adenylate kinase family enzyme
VLKVFAKESKKRQESAEMYKQGGSDDRVQAELAEKAIIDAYLPEQLSEEDIKQIVEEVITTTGASSMADMGKVIGGVKAKAGASAEGAIIARLSQGALKLILLIGIAGSGKGTQGKLLADKYKYRLITMGDIIRLHLSGEQRDKLMSGFLLDDQAIIKLLDDVLKTINDDNKVVLDGFPRSVAQAQWLLEQAKTGRFSIDHAIHLVASQEVVKQRLLARSRPDDHEQAIELRFKEYEKATKPVIDWLIDNGVQVLDVDGEKNCKRSTRVNS